MTATDAGRISDHGHELLADFRLRVGEHDGVAVALGHLAAIGARQLRAGGQQDLRLGKNLADIRLLLESPTSGVDQRSRTPSVISQV